MEPVCGESYSADENCGGRELEKWWHVEPQRVQGTGVGGGQREKGAEQDQMQDQPMGLHRL